MQPANSRTSLHQNFVLCIIGLWRAIQICQVLRQATFTHGFLTICREATLQRDTPDFPEGAISDSAMWVCPVLMKLEASILCHKHHTTSHYAVKIIICKLLKTGHRCLVARWFILLLSSEKRPGAFMLVNHKVVRISIYND